jgi:hypothetical protein
VLSVWADSRTTLVGNQPRTQARGEAQGDANTPNCLRGWKREGTRASTADGYKHALDLWEQLHGDIPVADIRKQHAREYRQAPQEVRSGRTKALAKLTLPQLVACKQDHPSPFVVPRSLADALGCLYLWSGPESLLAIPTCTTRWPLASTRGTMSKLMLT